MENIYKIILVVTDSKRSDKKSEHIITKFPIEIGRNIECDIPLVDERKLVSRKHAKIDYLESEFALFDLGSRNATYLNNEKILPDKNYLIKINDVIKIGEYLIQISNVEKQKIKSDDSQKTMMFSSPFAKEVENLAESFKNLSAKYALVEDPMRNEYLKMDFLSNFSGVNLDTVEPFISEYFSNNVSVKNENDKWANSVYPKVGSTKDDFNSEILKSKPSQENSNFLSSNLQFSNSIDILLESISKLIQGFWHFRQEFFGVTIYQSIPVTSLEELKKFLFDPTLSNTESNRRVELFNEELIKIQSHQVGLLDGYKDSINDGLEIILNELNPEVLAAKINNQNFKIGPIHIPYKYIPFYAKIKSMQMVKSIHNKLQIDINVIERKHFRPAFMKGYQKRINI